MEKDRYRIRVRFRKVDDLRFLGHRDLARVWERLLRRANVPFKMSEGFHPKPRISFPLALGAGMEGLEEVVELELSVAADVATLGDQLRQAAPPGLMIDAILPLDMDAHKARVLRVVYELPVPDHCQARLHTAVGQLMSETHHPIQRADREQPLDLRETLEQLDLAEGFLRMQLRVRRTASVRPREILAALGMENLEQEGCWLRRTRVELEA